MSSSMILDRALSAAEAERCKALYENLDRKSEVIVIPLNRVGKTVIFEFAK